MSGAKDELHVSPTGLHASHWLTKLESEELRNADEFDSWLRADPRHVREFLEITCVDRELQDVQFTADVPAAELVRQVRQSTIRDCASGDVVPFVRACALPSAVGEEPSAQGAKPAPSQSVRYRSRRFLACVAALCVLAVGISIFRGGHSSIEFYGTDVGQKRLVVLDDGSALHLNTASRIAVRFTEHDRVIELLQGEVVVEVGKDSRPFAMLSGPALFRDIGTRFVLRRDDKKTQLVVIEGRVAVGPASLNGSGATVWRESSDEVGPYEAVQLSSTRYARLGPKRQVSADDVRALLAWQRGSLIFRGETLAEAVEQVNRYNRRQIEIAGPAVARRRIGGSLRSTDAEEFAHLVERIGLAKVDATDRKARDVIRLRDND